MNNDTGKYVMLAGAMILLTGIMIYFFHDKLNWIGNLPGDIRIKKDNFSFYFPLTTLILLSLLLNIAIRIFRWLN